MEILTSLKKYFFCKPTGEDQGSSGRKPKNRDEPNEREDVRAEIKGQKTGLMRG